MENLFVRPIDLSSCNLSRTFAHAECSIWFNSNAMISSLTAKSTFNESFYWLKLLHNLLRSKINLRKKNWTMKNLAFEVRDKYELKLNCIVNLHLKNQTISKLICTTRILGTYWILNMNYTANMRVIKWPNLDFCLKDARKNKRKGRTIFRENATR